MANNFILEISDFLFECAAEEVRVELINLLDVCLETDKTCFLAHLGPLSTMLSKAAADSNPEMKQKVATFAGTLCRELRDNAGNYMKATVIGLTANLSH